MLKKSSISVKVILTKGALKFASPLSFSALGADAVYTPDDSFSLDEDNVSLHLSLSRWADLILIAPASADFIAKCANGVSDELALTTVLAFNKYSGVIIAPAMNSMMYENSLTSKNIESLKNLGVSFVDSEVGALADLSVGKGRLANEEKIFEKVMCTLEEKNLFLGKKFLITAGATREYIDPVRFITNGSSGAMGFSLAKAAKRFGGEVYLVKGHTTAKPPFVDAIFEVDTTEDLLRETQKLFSGIDILIMAAAPVDFKPEVKATHKIKKQKELLLSLKAAPDILKTLSNDKKNQVIVGFALETEDLVKNAKEKMNHKHMDIVIANKNSNIGKKSGSVMIIDKYGKSIIIENKSKDEIAQEILLFLKDFMEKEVQNGKK